MATLYLLHFHDRHGHAQHLLAYTDESIEQLQRYYRAGGGGGLWRAMADRGVDCEIFVLGTGDWRWCAAKRRELRRQHNNRRLCPRCEYGRARSRWRGTRVRQLRWEF
jgi:hypothetical protein